MSDKKKGTNFLMQGTILAAAAMITKIVGLAYRIPLTNIMGAEGNGYYGVVFQVYSLSLIHIWRSLSGVRPISQTETEKKMMRNMHGIWRS